MHSPQHRAGSTLGGLSLGLEGVTSSASHTILP